MRDEKTLIGVIGDNAQELGGYSTHNPFRLYCRTRFREFIQAVPEADVLIALRPGVGQWVAEVCVEMRRPFEVVMFEVWPPAWPVNIRTALDHLAAAASRRLLAKDVNGFVHEEAMRRHENSLVAERVLCFVAIPYGKSAGGVRAILNSFDKAGIGVAPLHPEAMPPSFAALGALEDARESIPDNLSAKMRKCAEQLREVMKVPGSGLTDKQKASLARRIEQAELIADLADVFCTRGAAAPTG